MPKVIQPTTLSRPLGLYSYGMIAPPGELIVVAGQVGVDRDGTAAPDVAGQTRKAFENVRAVLEAAGCGWGDVVRLQTFLTRAEDLPDFMRARESVFAEAYPDAQYPPNTLLIVSRLVRRDLLVEIEAMAVRAVRDASRPGAATRTATASHPRPPGRGKVGHPRPRTRTRAKRTR